MIKDFPSIYEGINSENILNEESKMKKNISYLKDYECYGCSACQHSCGAKAVSMKQNREGFWYPVVDEALCVECGRCEKVCPAINGKQTENTENPDTYALWA